MADPFTLSIAQIIALAILVYVRFALMIAGLLARVSQAFDPARPRLTFWHGNTLALLGFVALITSLAPIARAFAS